MAVTAPRRSGRVRGRADAAAGEPAAAGRAARRGRRVPRLELGADGDVVAGVLAVGDMPLGSDWTWAGATIGFAPAAASRRPRRRRGRLGTRMILEPMPGSTEYAIGRRAGRCGRRSR